MATPMGTVFFNNKKTVSQCDDEILGSTVKTFLIQFDQEKFKNFSLSAIRAYQCAQA